MIVVKKQKRKGKREKRRLTAPVTKVAKGDRLEDLVGMVENLNGECDLAVVVVGSSGVELEGVGDVEFAYLGGHRLLADDKTEKDGVRVRVVKREFESERDTGLALGGSV